MALATMHSGRPSSRPPQSKFHCNHKHQIQ